MRNQYLLKTGKLEVLEIYWEKITFYIQNQSSKYKDIAGNEICKKIMQIPKTVRKFILKKYID